MTAFRTLLRLLVAAALTGYVLWRSDPRGVLAAAAGADWRPIGFAALLVVVDRTLMAYRWVVLLCTIDPASRPPLGSVMRIFFVSTFVGTFLPASVGGDAVRAFSLSSLNVRGEDAVASVFMDRMLGVASVLLMAVVGLALAREMADNRAVMIGLAVAAAVCVATLALLFGRRSRHRFVEAIQRYAAYPRQLANVLVCSIAVQILRIIQAYYLGRGLGIDAGLATYFAFVPLILLVMLLPVTFNGIGTSQAAFVWFFGQVGVAAAPAFALSVLFVALGVVGNLPGGILFALGRTAG